LGEIEPLPIEITPPAGRQIDEAEKWWLVNRTAAPDAIGEEFTEMIATLSQTARLGRVATDVRTPNVRKVFLRRVGFLIYYRVTGSPPRLQIMAFWHARRGKGPPI
jgi:hypothetical protein